jgi:guanylate kinase
VKETLPGAVTIFIDAPLSELERRLRERATESEGEIEERIALARDQKKLAGVFDYVVENDDRERAAGECVAIVERVLGRTATMAGR